MRQLALVCAMLLLGTWTLWAQNSAARDEVRTDSRAVAAITLPGQLPARVQGTSVLYENGPFINAPGGGFSGADASLLQNTAPLSMTVLGFGQGLPGGVRLADEFTVTGDGWRIDSVALYGYQTGSTTTSSFTVVNMRIWDGSPLDPGSSVVWGDTATNRLAATRFTGVYRATVSAPLGNTRPMMENIADIGGLELPPGTYWLDWQSNGTIASGPWAPPITINGQGITGNAVQFIPASGWANIVDGGTGAPQQGLPFVIYGEPSTPPGPILSEDFEGGVFPPEGWSSYIVAGANGWVSSTTFPYSGTTHAYVQWQTAGTLGSKFLVTRRLDIPVEGTYELSFWMRRQFTAAWDPDTVYIRVSTTDSLPASFGEAIYKCYTGAIADTADPNIYGTVYKKFTTSLPTSTMLDGATVQFIAFDHQDDDGQGIYLDDVVVGSASGPVNDIGVTSLAIYTGTPEATSTQGERNQRGEKSLLERGLLSEEELLVAQTTAVQGLTLIPVTTEGSMMFRAIVRNFGDFEEASYQVGWSIDDVPQTAVNNTQPLAIGATDTLVLSWDSPTVGQHTARAWTILAGDANPANDSSAVLNFEIPPDDLILYQSFDDITGLVGQGWFFQNNSAPVGTATWFQGNSTVFPSYSGAPTSYIGANFNSTAGTGTISNWMLTPEIPIANGDTVSFWTRTGTGSSWPDRLELRLSTAGASTNVGSSATDVGDFTILLLSVNGALTVGGYPEVWTQFTAVLSGLTETATGRFGFRYFVTNGGPSGSNSNYIGIDDARVQRGPATSVGEPGDAIPEAFAVDQNYPNPFNPSTMIRYALPAQSKVVVRVFNLLGQVIAQLKDEVQSAGTYEAIWNGTTETGALVSSGVYFYRVEATPLNGGDAFVSQKKMLMLK